MRTERAAVVAAAVVVAAFLPALAGGFVYDDHRFLERNAHLGDVSIVWRAFTDPASQTGDGTEAGLWRPLRTLSFAFDRAVFGGAAWGPHVVSVLLHGAGTAALFALLRRLGATTRAALLGALVYGLHPAHTECVAWIAARGDVLASFLVIAALAADLGGRGRVALALGAAALLAKESAVVWPVLAFAAARLAGLSGGDALRRALRAGGVVVVYLVVRQLLLTSPGQEGGLGHGPARIGQILAMLGHQTWFALVPVRPVFDWQMPWDGLPVAAALAALALLASFSWKPGRNATLWFAAALAPTLFVQAVVPLNIMVADRFLVLALPALAIAVAAAVDRLRGAVVPAVALAGSLLALTETALPAWESDRSLWTATAAAVPTHWRANFWLGSEALAAGDARLAVARLGAAAKSGSADGATLCMYAQAIESLGLDRDHPERAEAARESYATSIPLLTSPRAEGRAFLLPTARLGHAEMSLALGDLDAARAALRAIVASPTPVVPAEYADALRARVRRVAKGVEIALGDAALAKSLLAWGGAS